MSDAMFDMMTNHSGATPISEAAPNHFLGSTETPCPPKVSRRPLPGSPQQISPAFELGGQIHRVTSRVSPRAMRLLTPILDPLRTPSTGNGSHLPSCTRTTIEKHLHEQEHLGDTSLTPHSLPRELALAYISPNLSQNIPCLPGKKIFQKYPPVLRLEGTP